jgi:hypothetical protein
METSMNSPSRADGPSTTETQGGSQDTGRELASDIKQHATDIKEEVKGKAREAARSGQSAAADQLHQLAEGVRRSADSWDNSQYGWLKQGLSSTAESLDRFSSTLRDRDIADLAGDMEVVVRRHPALFIGACAVAGFALARFLKSSGRNAHDADYASGYRSNSMDRSTSSVSDPHGGEYSSSVAQDHS